LRSFERGSTEYRAVVLFSLAVVVGLAGATIPRGPSTAHAGTNPLAGPTSTPGFLGPTPTMPQPCTTPGAPTNTWSGAGASTNFSDNLNWAAPGLQPTPGAPIAFPSGPTNTTANNDLVGLRVGPMTFDGSPSYSIGGNAIGLDDGRVTTGSFSGGHAINCPLTLFCDAVVNVSTLGSNLEFNGGVGGSFGMVKTGPSALILKSNISLSGQIALLQGAIRVQSGAALNWNGTSLAPGSLLFFEANTTVPLPNFLNATGGSKIQLGSVVNVAFDSTVNFFNGTTTLAMLDGTSLTFNGPVRGDGTVYIAPQGATAFPVVTVNNYEPSTSPTFSPAPGAILVLDGTYPNSDVALNGGKLMGTGSFRSLNGFGEVAPGHSPGILSLGGNATLFGGSTITVELNGTTPGAGYDQLIVAGTASIGSMSLNVSVGYGPTFGDTFTIVQAGALTGTFSGHPDNSTFSASGQLLRINYTATSVVLTALGPVPVELQSFSLE
jgi:hypothetical protein